VHRKGALRAWEVAVPDGRAKSAVEGDGGRCVILVLSSGSGCDYGNDDGSGGKCSAALSPEEEVVLPWRPQALMLAMRCRHRRDAGLASNRCTGGCCCSETRTGG